MSNFNIHNSTETGNNLNSIWKKIMGNKYYRTLLGVLAGAGVGLLYWNFIGCNSGSCALTSNPYNTTLLFGLMGGLFAYDKKNKSEIAENSNEKI